MQIVYQSERSECGLASLAMIADAHGRRIDLATMRARYPISLKGATLKDLVSIARDIGLETRPLRCEIDELDQVRLPAILHWRFDHFVVLVKRSGRNWIVNDPALGRISVSPSEFDASFTGVALEAWPGAGFARKDERRRVPLGSVIPSLPGLRSSLALLFVYALGMECVALALPIVQQLVIDNVLVTADTDLLKVLIIGMGALLLGQIATSSIRSLAQRNLSSTLSVLTPGRMFAHMAALSPAWFERRSVGDILTRLDSANAIQRTVTSTVITTGLDGIVAILAVAAMLLYGPSLTAVVIAAAVIYCVVRIVWYNVLRQQSQGMIVQNARVQNLLLETLKGIATIKLFNGVEMRHSQYLAALSRSVRLQNGVETANTAFGFAHDLVFAVERLAVLYLGASAVIDKRMSVGMLIAFLSFREHFIAKATSLINTAVEFRMLDIHLERVADILLTEPESKRRLPFLGERAPKGAVEVRGVSYRYGANEPYVLHNCSLQVKPGETLAIVGPSGAGKSTLFKILSGQIRSSAGEVLIDGQSLDAFGHEAWRNMIAVVRQDDVLFSGTLAENIALFAEKPDLDGVRDAARQASILDEILRMPMGFNTLIGELGSGLSGGQMQRIILARALYKKPTILLLDEATSHLDVETEKKVSDALAGLAMTRIVIAHRPETIARADRVVNILDIRAESS